MKLLIQDPLQPVVPSGISEIGDRLCRISFPPQTDQGAYQFTLLPSLLDAEGFELDQNANRIPGEPDDAYRFTLILDTVPPRVTHHEPAGDVAGTVDHSDLWFSEAMDTNALEAGSVGILDPTNGCVTASEVSNAGLNWWRIFFPRQTKREGVRKPGGCRPERHNPLSDKCLRKMRTRGWPQDPRAKVSGDCAGPQAGPRVP